MNQVIESIPIFSSVYTDKYSTNTDIVYIECCPLKTAIHFDSSLINTNPFKLHIELHEVKRNFVQIFKSMHYAVHLDSFGFSDEFSKMVPKSFLELLYTNIFNRMESLYTISNSDLVTLYRVHNFLENESFKLINRDFIDNVNDNMFSSSAMEDLAALLKEKIIDLDSSFTGKYVLESNDWGNFEKTIRDRISEQYGIFYSKL